MITNCPICKTSVTPSINTFCLRGKSEIDCSRCGLYRIETEASDYITTHKLTERQASNISGWLRESYDYTIAANNLRYLLSLKTPSFHERADKLLIHLEKETEYAGQCLDQKLSWQSAAWCINEDELMEFISFLYKSTRINNIGSNSNGISVSIQPGGWAHLEELKKMNADQKQGFVAMWFDKSMNPIYDDVMSQAILDAGYKPHRVDKREHVDRIDDEIIAQIKKSRFVLADFTGHRGGVYYEAGFAHGLGLNVFMTCRKDDSKLHFDIQQYNCIFWEEDKLEDFRRAITNRIEAVIGHGPYQNG